MKNLRIALVHDSVTEAGGAERVIGSLIDIFPEADVFTSVITNHQAKDVISSSKKITVAGNEFERKLVTWKRRWLQILAPFIWPRLKFDNYDLIISHGGFYMANLIGLASIPHKAVWCHYEITPPKNLYYIQAKQPIDYLLDGTWYRLLRFFDRRAMKRVDHMFSVSKLVGERLRELYSLESEVVYPPVRIGKNIIRRHQGEPIFGYVGRLSKEKNLDLLISVFNKLGWRLDIIGEGNEMSSLKERAAKNIVFHGFKPLENILIIAQSWTAMIHPAIEDDFPLAPIEMLGAGIPVIVSRSIGTREIIIEGINGVTFAQDSAESLIRAIKILQSKKIDPGDCRKSVLHLSENRFKQKFKQLVTDIYEKHKKS